ncbi:hypothetical protein MJG53_017678 [Ovis ammon polii x Ovis aries]|uniref:Uncharacterized protein n=1 Tax=Ovis ammon polii x Ovis aries TaxID=2918886 RepID=A0ACB9U9C9_9CETA|nr:hypothetical protein MJG53_017678 [Ovis ammon polii x Ovis aries]
MAIDRRREAAGGGPGRLPPAAEENGALPPGDAAASAPLGGRAGPGGGGDIQPLPAPHAAGGPHPSLLLLDYDGSVLPFLGGLGGGYQKTLVLLTWIPALFIGFSQFSDSFLLDQPNFWCRGAGKGAESAGVTATGRWDGGDLANGTSPPTTLFPAAPWGTAGPLGNGSGSGADGGEAPPLPSPPDKGDNASNCDCHAWDYGIRTGLVQNVVSKWDLVCDNAWKVHVAKFSLLVGLIFGYLITGCIADWFGRRPVLLFSIIFILIFGLTVALSVNVTMFSTLRFLSHFVHLLERSELSQKRQDVVLLSVSPVPGTEGKPDGHRVQQRPPQVRTQMPTHLKRSSKHLQHLPHPLSLGHSLSRFASRVWFARQALLRPWTRFLPSVLSGRHFGVALLFTTPFSLIVSSMFSLAHKCLTSDRQDGSVYFKPHRILALRMEHNTLRSQFHVMVTEFIWSCNGKGDLRTLVCGAAGFAAVSPAPVISERLCEPPEIPGETGFCGFTGIELCPPGKRFMITMVASFVTTAGQFLMPGLAALCRDWQVLQALIICPFLLTLLYWSIFPESLRWLMATHQFESAKKLILHFTQKNHMNPESDIKGVMPVRTHRLGIGRRRKVQIRRIPVYQERQQKLDQTHGVTRRCWSSDSWAPPGTPSSDPVDLGMNPEHCGSKLEKELSRRPRKVCIVKVVGTRNLWKNIVVLCVNSLTGFGIHHCFARSMMGHEVKVPLLEDFYADYYAAAGIALASCLAMCLAVRVLGRRGGLLLFMILTALASLLQLGLLNRMSDSVKDKFSIAFSIVGMFASHAVGSLSVFFCAEITPTVIRCGGLGLVLASAGFGMLTAPIIELHNQKGYFLHHVIFACCTLICIICLLLLPESRGQSLPESIPDGEHYTRQPLLPPRRGEQPLLPTHAELKDYSGLHDAAAAGDGLPDGATANGGRPM